MDKILQKISELRLSDVGRSLWSGTISNERAWYVSMWTKCVNFSQLEKGEDYLLLDGCGSFYKNNTSVGYFMGGSLIKVLDIENGVAKVTINGNTFRVTSDASFANTASTFAVSNDVNVTGDLHEIYYHIKIVPIKNIEL